MIVNSAIALWLFLVMPTLFLPNGALSATITGKVVSVADGDTITVLQKKQQYKIRLAEIDTPERRQPYGTKAKLALSDLVFGKPVSVEWEEKTATAGSSARCTSTIYTSMRKWSDRGMPGFTGNMPRIRIYIG